ncbi:probable RNA-directed DNA polymerase from transposon BS [Trichonephila inaurata madagascariensis]|uniref:Probable RNA-directed DNA polymerase from transposon BS n=1 Tax=Trichonephila inaurata madagascariensis TaxID=2747483 RepID=A0A8X6MF00_9ARAC|nr:probable RNA-directed DNA polymerase from transposon BS [Trichonephila inaurata madagascariensis]
MELPSPPRSSTTPLHPQKSISGSRGPRMPHSANSPTPAPLKTPPKPPPQPPTPQNRPAEFPSNLLESSFQENSEPSDDDFIDHVEERVDNFLHPNSRRHTAPLTSPQEIMEILLQLPNRKAPGKDGIKNIALKALALNAITNITKIFNSCLQLNYFPQEWKHALITVIPKAGKDPRFADNYCPISVISSLGKIFEKTLLKPHQQALRR